MAKKWIQKLKLHKGALKEKAERAGAVHNGKIDKSWLKAKASGNDMTAKQARLAIVLQGMHK